ncbi:MAG: HAMP domain-containing sensor histidine kinase [Clostridium sp.]|nr:HAMP domain-containing sensor histidine kinase [Clostridium sp.]
MIYRLRKKFILISATSILIVFTAIFSMMCLVSFLQLNRTMDLLTDAIASNDGEFPEFETAVRLLPSGGLSSYVDVITEETKFSTRFFTVWLDKEEQVNGVNVDAVFSISEEQAREYAVAAVEKKKERGWISVYRYKRFQTGEETAVVFVNGAMHRTMAGRFLLTSFLVLFGSGVIILGLFILLSKRAVKPVAESYEKQKQFITDANHELKTPLTLILSNLEIVEAEIGQNEWLDDIRIEGERMGMLVNQLVTLSRMDEEQSGLAMERFDLSGAVEDAVSEFQPLAEEREKTLTANIEPSIIYRGEENLIRRLVSILLDNAVKYCDPGGRITLSVSKRRHPVLVVENTYCDVDQIALEKLFDRFYRADKARTFDGGFGVGLSIARGIARQHHGDIFVYKKNGVIGFRVDLR